MNTPKRKITELGFTVFAFLVGSLALSPAFGAAAPEHPTGLTLSVDFNKTSYFLGEPVYVLGEPVVVRLSICNTSGRPITDRWFSYTRGFYLSLENAAGRRVHMEETEGERVQRITDFVYILAPGQTVTTAFDLTRGDIIARSECFPRLARWVRRDEQWVPGYVVEPGTYRLRVTQDLRMNKAEDGGLIRLRCSKEFTIREPNNVEKQALALFASQPRSSGPGEETSQITALADYEYLWKTYRETPYAPYALYYAARILQYQNRFSAALADYALLMQEFPQFPLRADALYYQTLALRAAKQSEQAGATALMLRDQFKNHLIAPDVATKDKGSRIQLLLSQMGM